MGLALVERLLTISGQVVIAMRNAPLVGEADQREMMKATKAIRAALLLRRFRSWDVEVVHDEGRVLGVVPPGQSDDEACEPNAARQVFADAEARIATILQLVAASRGLTSGGVAAGSSTVPPALPS